MTAFKKFADRFNKSAHAAPTTQSDIVKLEKNIYPFILFIALSLCCNQARNTEYESKGEIAALRDTLAPDTATSAEIIYRSTDDGKTWKPFAQGIPKEATVSSFLPAENSIYATTEFHGLFVIKEGYSNWVQIGKGLPDGIKINAITVSDKVFVIGTHENGIFVSGDNCIHWDQAIASIDHTSIRCLLTYKNKIFAGADDGIYESLDNGNTWKQVHTGVQITGFTELDNKIYAGVMNGAMMTNDEGMTWNYIYEGNALHDISNDGVNVYAMTLSGGLLRSENDGIEWENRNNGLGTFNLYTFEVKYIHDILFAAQWYGIYQSGDGGKNWQLIHNGLPDSTAFTTLENTPDGLIAGIGLRK